MLSQESMARMPRYEREEWIDGHWHSLYHDDDLEHARWYVSQVRAVSGNRVSVVQFPASDGSMSEVVFDLPASLVGSHPLV